MSVTVEGVVCIKDEIYHLVSCTNVETVAVPINAHVCRKHSIEHEILEFLKCVVHLCFVHDGIIAQIGTDCNPECATLPTGRAAQILNKKE